MKTVLPGSSPCQSGPGIDPQLDRIRAMEQALNSSAAAVAALEAALEQYEAVLPQLRALEEYYESPLWLQDYDADHAGLLPADLCRGVLTEDALYDLLCDNTRLQSEFTRLHTLTARKDPR